MTINCNQLASVYRVIFCVKCALSSNQYKQEHLYTKPVKQALLCTVILHVPVVCELDPTLRTNLDTKEGTYSRSNIRLVSL